MGSLTKVLCVILFISFMVFVAFFGRLPALRRTPIATLYKLIWINIPNGLTRVDQAVTGGRTSSYLSRFNNLMLYERHWTVVLFFLLIMVVGECLFVPQAWPQVGATTKVAVVVTISLPYIFLYLACAVDPGYITPENHAYHMSLYPYDHTVFHPGHMCKTCGFLKPPRSKHCSLCKRCIAKADHHCVFINSCVGYGNQHWFILLLASTSFLCTYGGILGMSLITVRVQRYIPGWSVWKPSHMTINKYLAGWGWGIEDNVNMGASSLLAALTSPLVWGLFFYTLYLVYCGTTTNETLKWSDWKEEMREGFAFRRSMSAFRLRNEQVEPPCPRWPLEVKQIIVTTQDGQPPKNDRLPGKGQWERVWNLSDVENLYDMGFWDNMVDIFVPDYTYGQRIDEPNAERRRRR